jgi:hypothetical protein
MWAILALKILNIKNDGWTFRKNLHHGTVNPYTVAKVSLTASEEDKLRSSTTDTRS